MPTDSETVEVFQSMLIAQATSGVCDAEQYRSTRKYLMENGTVKGLLPQFVKTCSTAEQFWQFIKGKFSTYKDRRAYIWDEFRPLLEYLEDQAHSPASSAITALLEEVDGPTVLEAWKKTLQRTKGDPEGAITMARTLLETICKHILDDKAIVYKEDSDLPGLYKMTAKELNIAPSQHSEEVFRQILGGCTAVVEGLGALRNRHSDAHGRGRNAVRPAPRHAELAVNLAGSMALFVVQTWRARST